MWLNKDDYFATIENNTFGQIKINLKKRHKLNRTLFLKFVCRFKPLIQIDHLDCWQSVFLSK